MCSPLGVFGAGSHRYIGSTAESAYIPGITASAGSEPKGGSYDLRRALPSIRVDPRWSPNWIRAVTSHTGVDRKQVFVGAAGSGGRPAVIVARYRYYLPARSGRPAPRESGARCPVSSPQQPGIGRRDFALCGKWEIVGANRTGHRICPGVTCLRCDLFWDSGTHRYGSTSTVIGTSVPSRGTYTPAAFPVTCPSVSAGTPLTKTWRTPVARTFGRR